MFLNSIPCWMLIRKSKLTVSNDCRIRFLSVRNSLNYSFLLNQITCTFRHLFKTYNKTLKKTHFDSSHPLLHSNASMFFSCLQYTFLICYCLTCLTNVLFTSFIIPEGEQVRRGTSGFGSRPFRELPPSSSRAPIPPCLHQGAVTYLALFAITLGMLNLMPPRIRRSLIPPCRPSTLPRLQPKMAAHFLPLSKQSACRG